MSYRVNSLARSTGGPQERHSVDRDSEPYNLDRDSVFKEVLDEFGPIAGAGKVCTPPTELQEAVNGLYYILRSYSQRPDSQASEGWKQLLMAMLQDEQEVLVRVRMHSAFVNKITNSSNLELWPACVPDDYLAGVRILEADVILVALGTAKRFELFVHALKRELLQKDPGNYDFVCRRATTVMEMVVRAIGLYLRVERNEGRDPAALDVCNLRLSNRADTRCAVGPVDKVPVQWDYPTWSALSSLFEKTDFSQFLSTLIGIMTSTNGEGALDLGPHSTADLSPYKDRALTKTEEKWIDNLIQLEYSVSKLGDLQENRTVADVLAVLAGTVVEGNPRLDELPAGVSLPELECWNEFCVGRFIVTDHCPGGCTNGNCSSV